MFDNITPQIIDKPYKIWIIDNFLQKDVIKSLNENWLILNLLLQLPLNL